MPKNSYFSPKSSKGSPSIPKNVLELFQPPKPQRSPRRRAPSQEESHKLYHINGCAQVRKCDFIKIIFHLNINGNTQQRKFSFAKIIYRLHINGDTQGKFDFIINIVLI